MLSNTEISNIKRLLFSRDEKNFKLSINILKNNEFDLNEFCKDIKCINTNSLGILCTELVNILTKDTIEYIEFLELSKTVHYSHQYVINNHRKNTVYKLEYETN